jgi:hypothetical protein
MADATRCATVGHFTPSFRAAFHAIGVLCVAVLLASCGGDSERNPTAPSAPPAPRVLVQGNFALSAPTEDAIGFAVVPVTDSSSGVWEANVDWAIDTNTLWMWVADGVCTAEQFATPECPFQSTCQCRLTVRSESATPKPRVLTIPGASGGTRTLIVANLGPRGETVQYRVTLRPSSSASAINPFASFDSAGAAAVVSSTGWKPAPHRR